MATEKAWRAVTHTLTFWCSLGNLPPASVEIIAYPFEPNQVGSLLGFRWIFLQRLLDHGVQFAFHLVGVAFLHTGDGAPHQRTRSWVAQIDDQGALGIRDPDDARAPAAPPGRIPLHFCFARRPEPVAHVEIGWPGNHGQSPRRQVAFDVSTDA